MNALIAALAVDRWEGTSTLLAAVVGGLIVLIGFAIDRRVRRDARRAEIYAGALQAVHDYLEAPYRIRRSSGRPEERFELVRAVSDIQSRIAYYDGLLDVVGPREVHQGYVALVSAARSEAGGAMKSAWRARPIRRNSQVPLGEALFTQAESTRARRSLLQLMK